MPNLTLYGIVSIIRKLNMLNIHNVAVLPVNLPCHIEKS